MNDSSDFFHPMHRERLFDLESNDVVLNLSASTPSEESASDELIHRVRQAVQSRNFYVLGRDELELLWGHTKSSASRDQLLRAFACQVGATLQPGWNRCTALLTRHTS